MFNVPKDLLEYFMEENCGIFALALHNIFSYELAYLMDDANPWSNRIDSIIHVFTIDENNVAFDITGARSIQDIKVAYYDVEEPRIAYIDAYSLIILMGEDDVECPLQPFNDEDFEIAKSIIKSNMLKYKYNIKQNPVKLNLPIRQFKKLYHVGTMQLTDKRVNSLEGAGLSVSTEPDAWRRIARGFVGGYTWSLIKNVGRLVDYYKLTKEQKRVITNWGIIKGFVEKIIMYRVSYYDDELDATVYSLYDTYIEAMREVTEQDEDTYKLQRIFDIAFTNKLNVRVRRMAAQRAAVSVFDLLLTVYIEDETDLDGIWWQDELDIYKYSAPRGVIVPSKIATWTKIRLD